MYGSKPDASPILLDWWKPLAGFEDCYEVSSSGQIRRSVGGRGCRAGRTRRPVVHSSGYRHLVLSRSGQFHCIYIHRAVATAFLGPGGDGQEVNHKDGNKANNRLSNLEWASSSENKLHAYHAGLTRIGQEHPHSRLKDSDVPVIRRLLSEGVSKSAVARKFKVSHSTIARIELGECWRHIA